MNETNLIIQNRLREATVSLERANLIICDETWKCDSSVPPFSSIQLSACWMDGCPIDADGSLPLQDELNAGKGRNQIGRASCRERV